MMVIDVYVYVDVHGIFILLSSSTSCNIDRFFLFAVLSLGQLMPVMNAVLTSLKIKKEKLISH